MQCFKNWFYVILVWDKTQEMYRLRRLQQLMVVTVVCLPFIDLMGGSPELLLVHDVNGHWSLLMMVGLTIFVAFTFCSYLSGHEQYWWMWWRKRLQIRRPYYFPQLLKDVFTTNLWCKKKCISISPNTNSICALTH